MDDKFKEIPDGYVLLERCNGKAAHAACMDGSRFHGWLFAKHPDGQWVSQRKLDSWEVMQVEDQRDDGIVHETSTARLDTTVSASIDTPEFWAVVADWISARGTLRDISARKALIEFIDANRSVPATCSHRRQMTTAMGAATGTGWKCKDCGAMITD